MTLLVVFHHTAIVYGGSGGWYYHEAPSGSSALLDLFCAVNQSYFMGLFFLIAGYLTPPSVEKRGVPGYIRERLVRLGLPLAAYVLLLSPVAMALGAVARGRSFTGSLLYFYSRGIFEDGPLWFALALLIFAGLYLAVRRFVPMTTAFPSNRVLLATAVGTGGAAFALRFAWPTGSSILGLQFGYFPSYVVLFFAGCAASRWTTLDAAPEAQRRLWRRIAWSAFPLLPVVVVLGRHFSAFEGSTSGGMNAQALLYAFWEPLMAWGIILALLHAFRTRFSNLGPVWSRLSRRAFAIYFIHPPVMVALALAWSHVHAPLLLKFAVTGSAACVTCYLLAGLLLRFAWLSRVF